MTQQHSAGNAPPNPTVLCPIARPFVTVLFLSSALLLGSDTIRWAAKTKRSPLRTGTRVRATRIAGLSRYAPTSTFRGPSPSRIGADKLPSAQVTFEPGNVYRRKSSLVPSESSRPAKNPDKTQCLVHQFLESQRRARHHQQHPEKQKRDGNHGQQVHNLVDRGAANEGNLASRLVEPKGSRGTILSRGNGNGSGSEATSDVGQIDEHEWAKQIVKRTSDVDQSNAREEHELHSRLLTKKQLSEMAWGVRELSRRLGSMKLKFRVLNIFILTKIYDRDLVPKTRELVRWLLDKDRDVKYTVYLEKDLKENKQFDAVGLMEELKKDYMQAGELEEENSKNLTKRLRWWDEHMCRTRPHTFDFAITLGGDGTVLYASWLFQRIVPPVLSFALGSLGFLTKFEFEDFQSILTGAFNEGVTVSLRLRFEGTIMRSQKRRRKNEITDGVPPTDQPPKNTTEDPDEAWQQSQRDLVEELIGEEKEDEHTHKPDGTYEILNEIVIDRGPNPSEYNYLTTP